MKITRGMQGKEMKKVQFVFVTLLLGLMATHVSALSPPLPTNTLSGSVTEQVQKQLSKLIKRWKRVERIKIGYRWRVGTIIDKLTGIGEPAVPSLEQIVWEASDLEARKMAIRALGRIGGQAIPGLIQFLGSFTKDVSDSSSEVLVQAGGAAVPSLIEALQNIPVSSSGLPQSGHWSVASTGISTTCSA